MNEFCTELRSLRKRIVSKTTEESEAVEVVIELIGTDLDKGNNYNSLADRCNP